MPRVLLVEDEDSSRRALARILRNRGCEVCAVADLPDGMAALSDHFDAVVADLMLPGGSGVELLRRVRERHLRAVLIVTTAADHELLRSAREQHPEYMLPKPISIPDLLRAVGV